MTLEDFITLGAVLAAMALVIFTDPMMIPWAIEEMVTLVGIIFTK